MKLNHTPIAQTAPLDADTLAEIIRKVDGNHSLGAGALAERIVAEMGRLNAPQLEQSELVEEAYCEGWNAGQEAIEQRYQHTPRSLSEGWELFKVENIDSISAQGGK